MTYSNTDSHIVSSTSIRAFDQTTSLAVCGEDLGPYCDIDFTKHVVGAYTSPSPELGAKISCTNCLERFKDQRSAR